MSSSFRLKDVVGFLYGLVCFVGNRADDHKWDFVQVSSLRNRGSLHFGTETVKVAHQFLFDFTG